MSGGNKQYFRIAVVFLLIVMAGCQKEEQPDKSAYLPFRFLVLAPGSYEDASMNQRCFESLQRLSRRLKIQIDYVENVKSGSTRSVITESGSKYNFVLGIDSQTLPTLIDISTANPEIKSAYIGHFPGSFDNLGALNFQTSHHYLAGVIAGLKTKTGKIGIIVDYLSPQKMEEVSSFIDGAKRVNSRVYCHTSIIKSDERKLALDAASSMKKFDIDVMFVNCGAAGNDVYKWGKAHKMMTIGSIEDQYSKAPGWVLTSVIVNYDVIFGHAIEQMLKGQWQGGLQRFGMADKATELAPLRGAITKAQKEIFDEVYREVAGLKGDAIEDK